MSNYGLQRQGMLRMRRDRGEIISCILGLCVDGASKTRIVYHANLNFKTVNPYLDQLTRNGLIDVETGSKVVYSTTDRGMSVLHSFRKIKSDLSGGWPPR